MLPVFYYFRPLQIDLAAVQLHKRIFLFIAPSQDRRDAEEQLSGQERFYHIVVRPQPESAEFVFILAPGCQEKHRIVSRFFQLFHQSEAVAVREHYIEDGQLRRGFIRCFQCFCCALRGPYIFVPFFF